ncbi:MAG: enoyl-CoA hydratase-related protein [Oceanisphaera sp.]|nr:enoyl-CoA hydratase-related protein [Oceanisphaera sp.]
MINDQGFTIGQPECLVGIVPGGGGSQRWPRLIGKAKALEWMLVGHQINPVQAEKLGIITGSFPKAEFKEKVQAFAGQISKRIPAAIRGIKAAVHEGAEAGLLHALSIEMEKTIHCFDDPTTQRAMAAYAEILKERIDVAEGKRATLPEIFEMVQSDAFINRIEGRA